MRLWVQDPRGKAEALLFLVGVRLALRWLPFPRVMRLGSRPRGAARTDPTQIQRVDRAVTGASRYVPGSRCLARALAGRAMLARRGIPSDLRFGVLREGQDLRAHAWLEAGGQPLLSGGPLDPYTPLGTPLDPYTPLGTPLDPGIRPERRDP